MRAFISVPWKDRCGIIEKTFCAAVSYPMYIECRETQMKRVLKIIAGAFSAVILFVLLYLISDAVLSRIVIPGHAEPGARAQAYIRTDGFHSDFVLPVRYAGVNFPEEFKLLNGLEKNPSVRYIAFG